MKQTMRQIFRAAAALSLIALVPTAPLAQGLFDPVVKVNDKVITQYEIDQRALFLKLLNAPGDPDKEARKQLIEDRLKLAETDAVGLQLTQDGVDTGVREFAGRANLEPEAFIKALAQAGVDKQTFMDFITVGLSWRELIRAKYNGKVSISEADIDKALNAVSGGSSVQVLMSEIIIPMQPGKEDEVRQIASRISQMTTLPAFAQAARQYSASRTRNVGGRLGWMPITKLPPALRPLVLGLAPGETTDPLPFQGAVGIFQLRAIEETDYVTPEYAAVEYAAYYIPGGRSEAALAQAAKIESEIDTCDDLYGINHGQPEELLDRITAKPEELPQDIALELAKLDKGEVSTNLTRNDGQQLVFLMMCGRTPAIAADASREAIAQQLRQKQLESYANGFLEELRSQARITYP